MLLQKSSFSETLNNDGKEVQGFDAIGIGALLCQ
jgi:hypothetical protein